MGERFIRMREVESRVGLKRSTIYRWIEAGDFPRPRKLAANCSVWVESAVDEWVKRKIAETDLAE